MKPYSKPFLSIEEQIALLSSRGMTFENVSKARHYLGKIGYYRLSGYTYPMRQSQIVTEGGVELLRVNNEFRDGTTFRQVVDLYVFDKKLRVMMVDVLERIEIALRNDLVLLLGERDRWAHRNAATYDGKFSQPTLKADGTSGPSKFDKFIASLDANESRAAEKEDFVAHFKETYSNPLPIWAAMELVDFGGLSTMISKLKFADKKILAAKYGLSGEMFPSWVWTLAYVRNVCAHHSRLWNKPMNIEPLAPQIGCVASLNHLRPKQSRERFYAAAAIARYFQIQISPESSWGSRFVGLVKTFPTAPGIHISQAGFTDNWDHGELWGEYRTSGIILALESAGVLRQA